MRSVEGMGSSKRVCVAWHAPIFISHVHVHFLLALSVRQFDCHYFICIIRDSFRHIFARWLTFDGAVAVRTQTRLLSIGTFWPLVSFYRRLICYFTLVRLLDGRCRLCFAYNLTLFYCYALAFRMSLINNPKTKTCHMTNTLIKNERFTIRTENEHKKETNKHHETEKWRWLHHTHALTHIHLAKTYIANEPAPFNQVAELQCLHVLKKSQHRSNQSERKKTVKFTCRCHALGNFPRISMQSHRVLCPKHCLRQHKQPLQCAQEIFQPKCVRCEPKHWFAVVCHFFASMNFGIRPRKRSPSIGCCSDENES